MRAMAWMALAAAAWAVPAGAAWAGKPSGGGGGTGGGEIVFAAGDTYPSTIYTMNSDGGAKSPVPSTWLWGSADDFYFETTTHGGHLWFVRRSGAPNQYYAHRDDGAMNVQLTTRTDLQFLVPGACAHWSPDGNSLGFLASRSVNGVVVEGGLYVAALTFDAAGNITGLASQPASPAFAMPLVAGGPDVRTFSWSPDGTRFVYETLSKSGSTADRTLAIGDLATGATRVLRAGNSPQWSADDRILWCSPDDGKRIWHVTASNGSGDTTLTKTNPWTTTGRAAWSPTGSHVVYQSYDQHSHVAAVCRVASTGGGLAVSLTTEFAGAEFEAWNK